MEKVKVLRDNHIEDELRSKYDELYSETKSLSWSEYLMWRALRDAIDKDPFLKVHRFNMVLSLKVKEWLYWNGVDRVLDLVQMTDEEIRAISIGKETYLDQIMNLLSNHGYTLLSDKNITFKISSNSSILSERPERLKMWTIKPAGTTQVFELERPCIYPEWFDEFYRSYGYTKNEEIILKKLVPVKAGIRKDEVEKIDEFFNTARDLWENYYIICKRYGIVPLIQKWNIPENSKDIENFNLDRFIEIKKDALRALISIFDEMSIYGNSSISDFFKADNLGKLDIAETEKNEHLQLLMTSVVAAVMDFESVVWYIESSFKLTNKPNRHWPLNPWMQELIMCCRCATYDDELHSQYRDYLKREPKKTWIDFLSEYALAEEIKEHIELIAPIEDLLIPIEDSYLKKKIESTLNAVGVERFGDLMQFTRDEIAILFDYDKAATEQIYYCLDKEGYCLRSSKHFTYKVPIPLNLI